jgi:hypothetical protein
LSIFRPRQSQQLIVQIEGNIQWQTAREPTTGVWIAVSPQLNLNASGDTWGELTEAMNEATAMLFTDLLESGELAAFLREHGWQSSPLPSPGKRVKFDVPLSLSQARSVRELIPA